MRQFIMHGQIGRGGFGVVYRATLKTPDFETEVAIKLLKSDHMPDDILRRFRDEARVLGLIRDPNVVRVYPPAQLRGRPALVLEYVDGRSTASLLKAFGPLPARVATEIVAEVARTLADVYEQPGRTGEPLHLIHRDIKPENLHITPAGHTRLLDFGIARANFDTREAKTTLNMFGTPQYMAPERRRGIESPAGDVFSLGCTWRRLMTGEKPVGAGAFQPSENEIPRTRMLEEALQFIERMHDPVPEHRPDIREVEEEARSLFERMGGPSLREWARESVVSPTPKAAELSGRLFNDELSRTPTAAHKPRARPRSKPVQTAPEPDHSQTLLLSVLTGLILAVVLLLLVVLGAMPFVWMGDVAKVARQRDRVLLTAMSEIEDVGAVLNGLHGDSRTFERLEADAGQSVDGASSMIGWLETEVVRLERSESGQHRQLARRVRTLRALLDERSEAHLAWHQAADSTSGRFVCSLWDADCP